MISLDIGTGILIVVIAIIAICIIYATYPLVEMAPATALIVDFMFLAVQRPYHA